jgi:hypothetical protein
MHHAWHDPFSVVTRHHREVDQESNLFRLVQRIHGRCSGDFGLSRGGIQCVVSRVSGDDFVGRGERRGSTRDLLLVRLVDLQFDQNGGLFRRRVIPAISKFQGCKYQVSGRVDDAGTFS